MQSVTTVQFYDQKDQPPVERDIREFISGVLDPWLVTRLQLSSDSNFQLMINEAFDSFVKSFATRNYGFDSIDTYHAHYFVDGKKTSCFYLEACGFYCLAGEVTVYLPYIGLKGSEHEGKLILLDSCDAFCDSPEYKTLKEFVEMLKSLEDYAKNLGIKDNLTDQANATEQEMTATEPAEKPIGNDLKDTPQQKEASLLEQKKAVVRQLLAALRGTPPVATSSTTVDAHPATTGSDSSAPANTTTPSTEAAGQTGARYVSQEMQRRLLACRAILTTTNEAVLKQHRHPAWDKFLSFMGVLITGGIKAYYNHKHYGSWLGSSTHGGQLVEKLEQRALLPPHP